MWKSRCITGYDSTLYIGIAMVFVISPYIRKFTFCFKFQVNLTFNDFTAQTMSKVVCVAIYFIKLPRFGQIITKLNICILSIVLLIVIITLAPIMALNMCKLNSVIATNISVKKHQM